MYEINYYNETQHIYLDEEDTEVQASYSVKARMECERLVSRANRCDELEEALQAAVNWIEEYKQYVSDTLDDSDLLADLNAVLDAGEE